MCHRANILELAILIRGSEENAVVPREKSLGVVLDPQATKTAALPCATQSLEQAVQEQQEEDLHPWVTSGKSLH